MSRQTDTTAMKLEEHPIVKRVLERSAAEAESDHVAPLDADWLRRLCLEHGADDVGFVETDRPELAKDREDILAGSPRLLMAFGKCFLS